MKTTLCALLIVSLTVVVVHADLDGRTQIPGGNCYDPNNNRLDTDLCWWAEFQSSGEHGSNVVVFWAGNTRDTHGLIQIDIQGTNLVSTGDRRVMVPPNTDPEDGFLFWVTDIANINSVGAGSPYYLTEHGKIDDCPNSPSEPCLKATFHSNKGEIRWTCHNPTNNEWTATLSVGGSFNADTSSFSGQYTCEPNSNTVMRTVEFENKGELGPSINFFAWVPYSAYQFSATMGAAPSPTPTPVSLGAPCSCSQRPTCVCVDIHDCQMDYWGLNFDTADRLMGVRPKRPSNNHYTVLPDRKSVV